MSDFLNITNDLAPDEKLTAAITQLTDRSHLFAVASVSAVYFWMESLKWGTVETTAYFMRSAGMFGAIACVCSFMAKRLKESSDRIASLA